MALQGAGPPGVKLSQDKIGEMSRSELKAFILDILRHQTHEVPNVVATKITVKELIVTDSIQTP